MFASLRLQLAFPALVALTLSCTGDLGPAVGSSTYVLREVAGDPLPTVLASNEFGSIIVYSDTIRLRHDGTGTISGVRAFEPLQAGIPIEEPTWGTADIRFQARWDRTEIAYVCPVNANCAPPPDLIAAQQGPHLHVIWGPSLRGRSPMIYAEVE